MSFRATGLNLRGPCESCGAPLATDQRYCVECGQRIGPPLSLPYGNPFVEAEAARFAMPMGSRILATLAVAALGFGLVVGTAMSTVLDDQPAMPPPHVAQARPSAPAPSASPGPVASTAPAPPVTPPSTFTPPFSPGIDTGTSPSTKTIEPKPTLINGTVAHVNPVAGSYSVANGGPLIAIHAKKLPNMGSKVRTPVRQLFNGTYAEDGKRKTKGNADRASFTGTVTFRDDAPGKDFYSVSGTGSSVLVRVPVDANGAATPPAFGTSVSVSVRFDQFTPPTGGASTTTGTTTGTTTTTTTTPAQPAANACDADGEAVAATPAIQPSLILTQTEVTVDQQSVSTANLEGIVQAVCPSSRQLVLSADDTRESARDAVIQVNQGIDLGKVHVGRAIVGSVELKPPDQLSLGGLASDQGIKGADSSKQGQGSL